MLVNSAASLNDAEYLVPALEHDVIKSRRTILGTRHPVAVLHLVQNLSVGHSCSFTNFTALHASRGGHCNNSVGECLNMNNQGGGLSSAKGKKAQWRTTSTSRSALTSAWIRTSVHGNNSYLGKWPGWILIRIGKICMKSWPGYGILP